MPIQVQLESGSLIGGGLAAFKAANVHAKPLDYGTLGHYRCVATVVLSPLQAANSRLFELRNAGSNLIVPTLIEVQVTATGDVSPENALWLSLYGCTNFTGIDDTNTLTPTAMVVRPTGMSAAPGGAQIRSLSSAFPEGMTGWTATKSGAHSSFLSWMSSASADRPPSVRRFICPAEHAIHPPVYAANQGFVIENAQIGPSTANTVVVMITVAWAEVTAY